MEISYSVEHLYRFRVQAGVLYDIISFEAVFFVLKKKAWFLLYSV